MRWSGKQLNFEMRSGQALAQIEASIIDQTVFAQMCESAWGRKLLRWQCADTGLAHELQQDIAKNGFFDERVIADHWGPVQVATISGRDAPEKIESQPPTVDLLQALYQKGYSVIINDLQQRSTHCTTLCDALNRQLGCGVNANAYLTPSDSQALDRHYDDEDVIVFQLSGSKHWQVWEPGEPQCPPLPGLPYSERQAFDGAHLLHTTLQPGDCIYLPAGFAHQATCSGEPSLHVTFSLAAWCLADLLVPVLQQLMRLDAGAFLRTRLPLTYQGRLADGSAAQLLAILKSGYLQMAQRLTENDVNMLVFPSGDYA